MIIYYTNANYIFDLYLNSFWNREDIRHRREDLSKLKEKEQWRHISYWAKGLCNKKVRLSTLQGAEVLQQLFMVSFKHVVSKCEHLEGHKYHIYIKHFFLIRWCLLMYVQMVHL